MASETPFRIAIVGAGIVGLTLAHALLERSIPVQVYEQSEKIRISGGGINATEAGVRALKACGLPCYEAFKEVGTPHHSERPEVFWSLVQPKQDTRDAPDSQSSTHDNVVEIHCTNEFGSMPRPKFLEALARRLPKGVIKFGHKIRSLGLEDGRPIELQFENGVTATADILLGCDGVNSRIRRYVVDEEFQKATFSHTIAARGLVSIAEVKRVVGNELAKGAHIGIGNGDGYVYYPVDKDFGNAGYHFEQHGSDQCTSNVTEKWKKERLKEEMRTTIKAGQRMMQIVDLLPDEIDVWRVPHLHDHPLPTFSKGRIALLGDAAHASTQYLGSGAGLGYEDAAVCAELLLAVSRIQSQPQNTLYSNLEKALRLYSNARIGRSQHVVQSSFEAGKLLRGEGGTFDELTKGYAEMATGVWRFDINHNIEDALRQLQD